MDFRPNILRIPVSGYFATWEKYLSAILRVLRDFPMKRTIIPYGTYKILGADLRLECARVRYYDAVVMSKEYPITGIHKIYGKKIHAYLSGHTNLHP